MCISCCVHIRVLHLSLKLMDLIVVCHYLNRIKPALLVLTALWMGNTLWYDRFFGVLCVYDMCVHLTTHI